MGIYDVTGSSYDTEKQIKSMWQPVTYDTRASNSLSPPFLAQANIQTGRHRRRRVHLHYLLAWSLSMCLCMCVRFTEVSNLSCTRHFWALSTAAIVLSPHECVHNVWCNISRVCTIPSCPKTMTCRLTWLLGAPQRHLWMDTSTLRCQNENSPLLRGLDSQLMVY